MPETKSSSEKQQSKKVLKELKSVLKVKEKEFQVIFPIIPQILVAGESIPPDITYKKDVMEIPTLVFSGKNQIKGLKRMHIYL